jgi:excisionase family DNA binding protein
VSDRPLKLTVQKQEAAELLGMSVDSFERHVQDELPVIRRGKMRLFRVRDLEQWADENAALTVGAK